MDDGVVSNGGVKRQLPLWMLGDQARNKSETVSSNSNDVVDDDEGKREDARVKKRGRRPKSQSRETSNDDGGLKLEEEEESSSLLIKCRQRKRKTGQLVSLEVDVNGEVAIGKKRKGRARKNPVVENSEHFEGYAENGEDEDLTVDDLMSIAKEFVQGDKDAQPDVSSKYEDKVGGQSQNIESRSSISVSQGNIRSFEDQGTSSCSIPVENPTSEVFGSKQTLSGNPTQDMLDLFLGPLLKKTQEQDKEGVLFADEINFTHEVKKQHSGVVLGEEPAVMMKKKTSLKDKVAMFLD